MMKNNVLDVVFLLDRSGSMRGMESDTIGGFNSYIESHKDKNIRVTTVLFDDNYEMIHNRKNINEISLLSNKEYYVRGCTALLDAIGKTIKHMDKEGTEKVVFMITTDGLENASRKYSKEQIKELIEDHKNFEFIYIGANIDSYQEAGSIGIKRDNISNYKKDKKGTSLLYKALGKVSDMMLEDGELNCCWKKELEDYIDVNKE